MSHTDVPGLGPVIDEIRETAKGIVVLEQLRLASEIAE